jgi:hypothetical protein
VVSQLGDDLALLGTALLQRDADEDVRLAAVGDAVVELGDAAHAHRFAEIEETARALRDGHAQQRFLLFTHRGSLGDVPQAGEVDVGSGQHGGSGALAAWALGEELLEAGDGQHSRRFGDRAGVLVNVLYRRADRVVVDRDDLVQQLRADAIGQVARAPDRHASAKCPISASVTGSPAAKPAASRRTPRLANHLDAGCSTRRRHPAAGPRRRADEQ